MEKKALKACVVVLVILTITSLTMNVSCMHAPSVSNQQELNTSLLNAAQVGDAGNIKSLLKKGANVNYVDSDSWTALMWAVCYGNKETAKVLLEAKADVNYTTTNGWTALNSGSR
jgi:ankyrin repeat protein